MFCSNCGAKLDDSALFCGECGTKVEAAVAAAVEETKEVVETAVETAQETVEAAVAEGTAAVEETKKEAEAAPVAEQVKQEEAPTPEKKKGGKGGLVALIIVLVLLLAGGGVAAWYFTGDDYNSQKNLKLAEEAFAAGELENAKDYYETVLDYDETQKDVYIKLADIDMQEGKYESAIKTLQKGIKNTEDVEGAKDELTAKLEAAYSAAIDAKAKQGAYEDALKVVDEAGAKLGADAFKAKKKDIYNSMIDAKIVSKDYNGAIATATIAFDATQDAVFTDKKAEVYSLMVKDACEVDDFYYALGLVEQGYYETQSDILVAVRVDLYKEWVAYYLASQDFYGALGRAEEAYAVTNDSYFSEELIVEIYRGWAIYEELEEDYDAAIRVLNEGIAETDSEELKSMLEEIENKRIIIKKTVTNSNGSEQIFVYDEKGKETESYYYEDGNLLSVVNITYDAQGEISTMTQMDGDGNVMTVTEYTWEELEGQKVHVIVVRNGEGKLSYETKETEDGKMLSYVYVVYDGDEETVYTQEYTYDEHGNLTMEKWTTGEEVVSEVTNEYTYDANGKMLEKLHNEGNGTTTLTIYGDNTETTQMFDENEAMIYESESVFEKDGKLKEYYVVATDYSFTESYTYDVDGNVLTAQVCDLLTGDITTKKYDYDVAAGTKVVTCYITENDEEVGTTSEVYQYSENGDLTYYEAMDENGITTNLKMVEYDKYGNITYEREIALESDIETYISYEYDFVE